MSMKHTPEPWECTESEEQAGAFDLDAYGSGRLLATFFPCPPVNSHGNEAKANCERAASCVNACAGIPTEALESGVVAEMRKALEDCITNPRATCIVQNDVAYMIRRFKAINAIVETVLAKLTPQ